VHKESRFESAICPGCWYAFKGRDRKPYGVRWDLSDDLPQGEDSGPQQKRNPAPCRKRKNSCCLPCAMRSCRPS